MWLVLLFACGPSPHPEPTTGPVQLMEPWADLDLPLQGATFVRQRADSLVARGPEESLSVDAWSAALEGHGWGRDAESVGRRGLHAVRYVRATDADAPAGQARGLVFGATRYDGRATHTLTFVEVP